MSDADRAEFQALLNRMDENTKGLQRTCGKCYELQAAIQAVGVIHRIDSKASDQEKAVEKQKIKAKTDARSKLKEHLKDVLFKDQHQSFIAKGWWTKWVERVRDVVRPYYVERGLISDEKRDEYPAGGRSVHPENLPSSARNAAPFYHHRVSHTLEKRRGSPEVGHFIVCKGNQLWNPIWVGKIEAIISPNAHGTTDKVVESNESTNSVKGRQRKRAASSVTSSKSKTSRPSLTTDAASISRAIEVNLSSESETKYKIKWWTFVENSKIDLKEASWMKYLEELDKKNPIRTSPVIAAGPASSSSSLVAASTANASIHSQHSKSLVDLWKEAKRIIEVESRHCRLPAAFIDRIKDLQYAEMPNGTEDSTGVLDYNALTLWGDRTQILNKDNRLSGFAFKGIQEDWVELHDASHNMSIDHTAENNRMEQRSNVTRGVI
jgi:hypothetical protein